MDRRTFLQRSIGASVAILIASYPILIERNIVTVNRYKVFLDDLPHSFNNFTIAHLTDIHIGTLVSESFVQGVVDTTNRLMPDLIACTGDFVHKRNTTQEIDRVWPLLSQLNAKYGVCSVLGNHDHWADTNRSLYWLKETGQDLRHKHVLIEKGGERLVFGGAGDLWEDDLGIDKAFVNTKESDCRILLAHNPDTIDQKFNTRIALTLCGHTHGGQVRLPFFGAPVLPVKNKLYSSGLISTKKTQLFISRGIGWAIYPIRCNCFPEIAVLELLRTGISS